MTESQSLSARSPYREIEPLFICLGVPKAGTTWIHRQLEAHPQIGTTFGKEINYWSGNFNRGPGWYISQFRRDSAYLVHAEVSVGYLRPEPLTRISQAVSDAKFMVSLRNPYERAWSSYWQSIRAGDYSGPLNQAVVHLPKIVNDSTYADGISSYLDNLPRENLHVALFEDLQNNPSDFIREIYRFIGVTPTFSPDNLTDPVNVGRQRSWMDVMLARTQRAAKRLGVQRKHLLRVGAWGPVERAYAWLGARSPIPAMSEEDSALFDSYFRPDISRLEELLQRDFSHWLPGE